MQRHDRDEGRPPLPGAGYLEDYTLPFLIAAGVICFVALFAIWVVWGLAGAVIAAVLADLAIRRR